jgi:hypothetical protein
MSILRNGERPAQRRASRMRLSRLTIHMKLFFADATHAHARGIDPIPRKPRDTKNALRLAFNTRVYDRFGNTRLQSALHFALQKAGFAYTALFRRFRSNW